jgi:hypothetical protein
MAYRISFIERNAALNGAGAQFNQGGNPAVSSINIYSTATSQPATPETGVPGGSVLLVNVPFNATAFNSAVSGVMTANALPFSGTVTTTGTAGWFSFITGASGTPPMLSNGTVSVNGGSGDMTFDNINFVLNGVVVINGLSISQPM